MGSLTVIFWRDFISASLKFRRDISSNAVFPNTINLFIHSKNYDISNIILIIAIKTSGNDRFESINNKCLGNICMPGIYLIWLKRFKNHEFFKLNTSTVNMTSAVPATQGKKTIYVGGLAEEVDEKV